MMISLSDDATRCPHARSRDVGSNSYLGGATGAVRREPRGGDRCAGISEPLHLQLIGDVSGRWLGCVEGEAHPGAAEEAQSARHSLGVQDGNGTQPAAAGLSVCAVDARDDCALDREPHRSSTEPGVCRALARAAGTDLSEAPVAGLPARWLAGTTMAQARVPADSGGGEAGKGGDLLRGRVRGALGPSQRQDLGAPGRDADCAGDRAALLTEHDLRDQPQRGRCASWSSKVAWEPRCSSAF